MDTIQNDSTSKEITVLLVSGSCCVPQLALLDQQAQQVIHQALEETGITAQVKMVTASSAVGGAVPLEILKSIKLAMDGSNLMRLPAILINNKLISLGVPNLDAIKDALGSA